MQIRDALDTDLAGILEIYNDAVQNSTAIWNDKVVDLDNRRAWLAERHEQGAQAVYEDVVRMMTEVDQARAHRGKFRLRSPRPTRWRRRP